MKLREMLEKLVGVEKNFKKCICNHYGVFHPTDGCPLHGEKAWNKNRKVDQAIQSILQGLREKQELHTHDSIPTYTSEAENGCVTCIRNQCIADLLREWGISDE